MSPIEWRPGGKKPNREGLKWRSNENPEKQPESTPEPKGAQPQTPVHAEYTESDLEHEKQELLERARRMSGETSKKMNEIAGEHEAEMQRMWDDLNKKK